MIAGLFIFWVRLAIIGMFVLVAAFVWLAMDLGAEDDHTQEELDRRRLAQHGRNITK